MSIRKWTWIYWVLEQDDRHYVGAYETDGVSAHGTMPPKDKVWQQISEVQFRSYAMILRDAVRTSHEVL